MPNTIAENAGRILQVLYEADSDSQLDGGELAAASGLNAREINDAVTILVENGYAEWLRFLGTAPFEFGAVHITARGRFEFERARAANTARSPESTPASGRPPIPESQEASVPSINPPPSPIGSPYGFADEDWEIVAERKGARDRLNVVLGYQFASAHYDSADLRANLERMFAEAVAAYNALPGSIPATLNFRALSAGCGEHLFNEIARDIISADIAVFDTSDLNPNVMLEVGVALTWGVRVLVIKKDGCARPPSDVSGQTWADDRESAAEFLDPGHAEKLLRMVERAIRKKVRA